MRALLQEAADDGGHRDGVTHAGDAWPEAADATHLEVNTYPGLGGTIERLDALRIHQSVHFEGEIPITMLTVSCDLAVNPRQDLLAQAVRGDEQLVIRRFV
jgi:hypothetical protein